MELDDRRIRVDFSITDRAHTPTPGTYMGSRYDSRYIFPKHTYSKRKSLMFVCRNFWWIGLNFKRNEIDK